MSQGITMDRLRVMAMWVRVVATGAFTAAARDLHLRQLRVRHAAVPAVRCAAPADCRTGGGWASQGEAQPGLPLRRDPRGTSRHGSQRSWRQDGGSPRVIGRPAAIKERRTLSERLLRYE